uniref:Putative wrky transcription factor protein 1-like isoform x6 n=1 Tax=Tabanus bromius TaxID=304241 RepID=A0A0K8TQI2_TABBR
MAPMLRKKNSSTSTPCSTTSVQENLYLPRPNLPCTDAIKSMSSSLSERVPFDGFGQNCVLDASMSDSQVTNRTQTGVQLELKPHAHITPNADDDSNSITRQSWLHTSFKRMPLNSGTRQLGSNALASHLYRSSSFNSSGRSSNCDATEDSYTDLSLEDVQDLNQKLELLQRQVTDLADSQNTAEDRTIRTKTAYAVLQTRYHMLEEQLRETEMRAEERLAEEQKRHRELLARIEREAALQNENCQIKIKTIEIEARLQREEFQRLRVQCDKQANDLHVTEEKLETSHERLSTMHIQLEEALMNLKKCQTEKKVAEDLVLELTKELDRLKSERLPNTEEILRLEELHQELDDLRQKNKKLEDHNEELQTSALSRGVEEGRNFLTGKFSSLAQELEEISQVQDLMESTNFESFNQLQQAFKEKEEENQRLKHYIDAILLNIVENYPELLEVKSRPAKSISRSEIAKNLQDEKNRAS